VIFVSAVLASPVRWRRKLAGALLGLPVLAAINLVRIVSLSYIDHWFPQALETAHYVVWQSLMVFFTVVLWLLWVVHSKETHETSPA
jgi:exosortase/archaeosortase family protein